MNRVLGNNLPVSQAALLWCMRKWVLELSRGVEAEPHVTDMLHTLGVTGISWAVRDLVETLSQSSTRMIEVQCTCQNRLSDDERALLHVLSLVQSLDFAAARLLLSRFVTPEGAATVIEKADAIGTALLYAGHSLPASHDTVH